MSQPISLILACIQQLILALPTNQAPIEDDKAIRTVLDAQVVAWNKGDLNGFMTGYWNDEQLFYISGGKTVQGWKALKERYQQAYRGEAKEMGTLNVREPAH